MGTDQPQADRQNGEEAALNSLIPGRESRGPSNPVPLQPWQVPLPESRYQFHPEYLADPETAVIAYDAFWREAGADYRNQYEVCVATLRWLIAELSEASKCGRMFLRVLPDGYRELLEEGAQIVHPYKKFHELYLRRVYDWLRRSVSMAFRGYGKFGLGVDAILDLVSSLSKEAEKWAMPVSVISVLVDQFDIAAKNLDEILGKSIAMSTKTLDPLAGPLGIKDVETDWESDRQIIETLKAVGRRLTTSRLISEMEKRKLNPSESTIKKRLSALVKERKLDKDPKAKPRGYGLQEWSSGSSGSLGS